MRNNLHLITWLSLLLMACNFSTDKQLVTYIAKIKARSMRPVVPIPQYTNQEKFHYPVDDKRRDPFQPARNGVVIEKRIKQPLERYALESLHFVGTLKQGTTRWALISHPVDQVSHIKQGEYIGKNAAKVISINENVMKLIETVYVDGKWKQTIKVLGLKSRG